MEVLFTSNVNLIKKDYKPVTLCRIINSNDDSDYIQNDYFSRLTPLKSPFYYVQFKPV